MKRRSSQNRKKRLLKGKPVPKNRLQKTTVKQRSRAKLKVTNRATRYLSKNVKETKRVMRKRHLMVGTMGTRKNSGARRRSERISILRHLHLKRKGDASSEEETTKRTQRRIFSAPMRRSGTTANSEASPDVSARSAEEMKARAKRTPTTRTNKRNGIKNLKFGTRLKNQRSVTGIRSRIGNLLPI